jgi:hypothetical protein
VLRVCCLLLCIAWLGPSAAQEARCPPASPGWTVDLRKGLDFHVCYYSHRATRASVGLYRGFHPSFAPPAHGLGIAGSIAGLPTVWFRNVAEGSFHHYDAVMRFDDNRCSTYRAHAWVLANNLEELERGLQLAADLPLQPLPVARDRYALTDLKLMATGGQWAEFREPSGQRRRFGVGERVGNRSRLVAISASNATVEELFHEDDCELKTRRCVFTEDSVSCPPALRAR